MKRSPDRFMVKKIKRLHAFVLVAFAATENGNDSFEVYYEEAKVEVPRKTEVKMPEESETIVPEEK